MELTHLLCVTILVNARSSERDLIRSKLVAEGVEVLTRLVDKLNAVNPKFQIVRSLLWNQTSRLNTHDLAVDLSHILNRLKRCLQRRRKCEAVNLCRDWRLGSEVNLREIAENLLS